MYFYKGGLPSQLFSNQYYFKLKCFTYEKIQQTQNKVHYLYTYLISVEITRRAN
jgi:hypothetical protein